MSRDFSSQKAYKRSLLIEAFASRIRHRYFWSKARWSFLRHGIRENPNPYPMPKYDGNPNQNKQSSWEKAADLCLEQGLHPDILVEAAFFNRTQKPAWPNELISAATLLKYNEVIPSLKKDLKESLQAQNSDAMSAWNMARVVHNLDHAEAWRYVLLSDHTPLSPLFRYCGAFNQELDELADKWFGPAIEQYACAPEEYDQIWNNLIPDNLKETVRSIMAAAHSVTQPATA